MQERVRRPMCVRVRERAILPVWRRRSASRASATVCLPVRLRRMKSTAGAIANFSNSIQSSGGCALSDRCQRSGSRNGARTHARTQPAGTRTQGRTHSSGPRRLAHARTHARPSRANSSDGGGDGRLAMQGSALRARSDWQEGRRTSREQAKRPNAASRAN